MLYWRTYATIIVRTVLGGFLAGLPQFTEKKKTNKWCLQVFFLRIREKHYYLNPILVVLLLDSVNYFDVN